MFIQEHDMQDQDDIVNIDNDGFNPPEHNFPQEVEGATGYQWNYEQQVWQPIFANQQQ